MLNNKYFSFEKFKIKKQKIYPYHFIQTNHFCELKTDNQCNNFIIRFDVKK
jgi:hypothetical protein